MRDLHTADSVLSSRMADRSCLEVAVAEMPRGGSRGATVGESTSLIFYTAATPMTTAPVFCCILYFVRRTHDTFYLLYLLYCTVEYFFERHRFGGFCRRTKFIDLLAKSTFCTDISVGMFCLRWLG